jgi:hypothetical protein
MTSDKTAATCSKLAQRQEIPTSAAPAPPRRLPLRAIPVGSSFCQIVDERSLGR